MIRAFGLLCVCLAVVLLLPSGCAPAPTPATSTPADAISGRWTGDWGPSPDRRNDVSLDLKWDGTNLQGTVNTAGRTFELGKASFNSENGAVTLELDAQGRDGNTVHYTIDGKVSGNTMTGAWRRGDERGDFRLTRR